MRTGKKKKKFFFAELVLNDKVVQSTYKCKTNI